MGNVDSENMKFRLSLLRIWALLAHKSKSVLNVDFEHVSFHTLCKHK